MIFVAAMAIIAAMNTPATPLPPKPQPPVDYDCCGGGCADCDLRRYHQALAEWQRLAAAQAAESQ